MAVLMVLLVCLFPANAQGSGAGAGLSGVVTDPSGAAIPGALVELRWTGGERRTRTDRAGAYGLPHLAPGSYDVRISAKNFATIERKNVHIERRMNLDAR